MVSLLCRWFYNLAIWFYFELSTFLRYLSVLEEKGYRTKEKYLVMVLFSLHLSLKFFKHWITHKNHCIKLSDSIKNIFPILIFFNLNVLLPLQKRNHMTKSVILTCLIYFIHLFKRTEVTVTFRRIYCFVCTIILLGRDQILLSLFCQKRNRWTS